MDNINHPSHYTSGKIEVIDFIEDQKLGFNLGNAVKYIARAGKKDSSRKVEDLQKAVWYLEHAIKSFLSQQADQPGRADVNEACLAVTDGRHSTERVDGKLRCKNCGARLLEANDRGVSLEALGHAPRPVDEPCGPFGTHTPSRDQFGIRFCTSCGCILEERQVAPGNCNGIPHDFQRIGMLMVCARQGCKGNRWMTTEEQMAASGVVLSRTDGKLKP